jgi:hypothetical protein
MAEREAPDLEGRIPDPLAEVEEAAPPAGPLRSFVGLFLVPLAVVLACVAVFIGFGWIAYEGHSTADYVEDLSHWSRPRRSQAAYELAKILIADPEALDEAPQLRGQVREVFASREAPEIRRYLALVLGHTRDREALPLLLTALEDPDAETRIYALWALGAIGDPRALAPLEAALAESDPGVRKTAAFALGELGLPEALPALRRALDDPVADVRWNGALALARLGSDAGLVVLREMLDRGRLALVPGITPAQQEDAMVEAVKAVAAVGGPEAEALLSRLAADDPSLKVRQAALEARRTRAGVDSDTGFH